MYELPQDPARHPLTAGRGLSAWARREDGSMTIFGLLVFFAMLLVAGIAIDAMRFEHERVRMQGATDRSVLAGTMLRQNISGATPEQLIRAFMQAEGMGAQVEREGSIVETEISGGRMMTVFPEAAIPASFMRWFGINELNIATPSTAIEALGRVDMEVVMVLDVTGSMTGMTGNGLTRIQNLRLAAADLAEVLLGDDTREHGQVALTIVPYAEHVLPPPGFINHFVNLPASGGPCPDFTVWNDVYDSFQANVIRRNCATQAWRQVRPYVDDLDEALEIINGLQASGTTSIDLGVRFGAMFFDPTINPAIQQMVSNGVVDPVFEDRPYAWGRPATVRAMVLMTDGENCCGGRFNVNLQDQQAIETCDALRSQGVIIYAVAFEAPARGIALMQQCASSENHFFNTTGSQISEAFAAIGNHIQTMALRLIQ